MAGAGAGSLSGNFMKVGAETNSFGSAKQVSGKVAICVIAMTFFFDVYLSTKKLNFFVSKNENDYLFP